MKTHPQMFYLMYINALYLDDTELHVKPSEVSILSKSTALSLKVGYLLMKQDVINITNQWHSLPSLGFKFLKYYFIISILLLFFFFQFQFPHESYYVTHLVWCFRLDTLSWDLKWVQEIQIILLQNTFSWDESECTKLLTSLLIFSWDAARFVFVLCLLRSFHSQVGRS